MACISRSRSEIGPGMIGGCTGELAAVEVGRQEVSRNRPVLVAEYRGVLDHVGQLADVAGPDVRLQQLDCVLSKVQPAGTRLCRRNRVEQMLGHLGDVVQPVAQRRQEDLERVDAVHEVFAKFAGGDHLRQVAMRRAHDAHVDAHATCFRRRGESRGFPARAAAWPASPWAVRRFRPERSCRRWRLRTARRGARRRR